MKLEDKMKGDEFFMREALAEAQKSLKKGEVPVGAVLVLKDEVVSRAHNAPIARNDPTAHAEISALRKAGSRLGNYRLTAVPCAWVLWSRPESEGWFSVLMIQRAEQWSR